MFSYMVKAESFAVVIMLKGYHTPFPVIVELTWAVRATAIGGSDAHTVPPHTYIDLLHMCRTME